MEPIEPRPASMGTRLQIILLIAAPLLALAPPADGVMLVAPVLYGDRGSSLGWVWAAGATPVARGPYPGSYIVQGARAALFLPALKHGALLMTGRVAPCGARDEED